MITQHTKVNDMIETPNMKIQKINVIVNDKPNKPYLLIPNKFENFAQILLFWDTNKFKMVNRNYRKQYTANEKQRIYRIKKIIKAFHQQLIATNVVDTTEQFEIYFRKNNKSMYSLARNCWSNFI